MHNSLQNLSIWKRKPTMENEKTEILEMNETSSTSPEDNIEALNQKYRQNDSGTKFCENQRRHDQDLLFRDDKMMSRLTRALFALKIGSFRDLMLGPQVVSG